MDEIYNDCEVPEDDTKYCVYCKEEIEGDEFYIDECSHSANGETYICEDCIREYAKEAFEELSLDEKLDRLCIRKNKEVRI